MSRILIVEDDTSMAFGLEFALEKEGFEVFSAVSAKQGMELFEEVLPNLVLLDLGLPDISGFEVCRFIKDKGDVPIVFLTAVDEEKDIVNAFEMGANDYVTKPFRVGELMARVKAILKRNEKQEEQPEKPLTVIERRLLEILKANKNQVVTRNILLEKLWDCKGNFVDDNTLSVNIKRLREKIGSEHIVTIRGVGYKWKD